MTGPKDSMAVSQASQFSTVKPDSGSVSLRPPTQQKRKLPLAKLAADLVEGQ